MRQDDREVLDLLKFELGFVKDGAYGRSPRTPWRALRIFEDSPTCVNFDDPARSSPCAACPLMQFVPEQSREESAPCRFIPLGAHGENLEDSYRCRTQAELEAVLQDWLEREISQMETRGIFHGPAPTSTP